MQNQWLMSTDSQLAYADVRFKFNHFDRLALTGDADSFYQPPGRLIKFLSDWFGRKTLCQAIYP